MLVTSIIMLILGFFGLVAGIVLICMKKTRKAGIITTVSSVGVGIIFTILLVVGAVNEGVKAVDEASSDGNYTSDTDTSSDNTADDSEAAPEAEDTSEEGTRANPMPLNSPLSVAGTMTDTDTYDDFDVSMDITVIESIRGQKAWELIQAENQFNEPAPEGKEYILNKIQIKAYDIASPENKFNMSEADFEYVSGSGTTYGVDGSYAVIPNSLDATLYNDATGEGYIYGIIDKSDTDPLVKFLQFYFKAS